MFARADWVIDGTKIYVDDAQVYMSADPHTLSAPGFVFFNITLKVNPQDTIDFVWGVDRDEIRPRSLELWTNYTHPTMTTVVTELWGSIVIHNVTSYHSLGISNYSSYPVDYGNANNTFLYWVNYTAPNGTLYYIIAFSAFVDLGGGDWSLSGNYNTSSQVMTYPSFFDWMDISSTPSVISYDYDGFNTWYLIEGAILSQGVNYTSRAWMDINPSSHGKYGWAAKPHSQTIDEAISLGNFYYIDPWYNTAWLYSKKITIDYTKVAGNLINFPVLIDNTSSDFSHAQTSGNDFLFVSADNVTKYNHEIENYSSVTNRLIAWVNVTSLSSTVDTVLYLYYGNPSCGNQQNVNDTWDADFVAVYHLNDSSTNTILDSTRNDKDGAKKGTGEPNKVAAKIGNGQDLDGANDYINFGTVFELVDGAGGNCDNATFSMWINADDTATTTLKIPFGIFDNYWALKYGRGIKIGNNKIYAQGSWNTDHVAITTAFTDVTNYHLITGVFAASGILYVDGVSSATGNIFSGNGYAGAIGTDISYKASFFNGIVDEVRVSTGIRSANWILTEFNNQNSSSTFITVGAELNVPPRIWVTEHTGYNTFANTASWLTAHDGFSLFGNTSSWLTAHEGYNTFGNNASWLTAHDGFSLFGNTSSWLTAHEGYNTFGNTASWLTIQEGYNTFGESVDWQEPIAYASTIFGESGSGTIELYQADDIVQGSWFITPSYTGINTTSITALIQVRGTGPDADEVACAIYEYIDYITPGALIASTETKQVVTGEYIDEEWQSWYAWVTFNFTSPVALLPDTYYYLVIGNRYNPSTDDFRIMAYDENYRYVYCAQSFDDFPPDPFNTAHDNYRLCIYADITYPFYPMSGYSTFGNTSDWLTIQEGYNTFGNTSDWLTVQEGYNTFGENVDWLTRTSGFNTFGNTAAYTALSQGYSTFGNTSLWNAPATGFNTFGNASAWVTLQDGYSTFGNTILFVTQEQGWNSFGNTSQLTVLYEGFNTFGNQNFTIFIDWSPKDNDTVDPQSFTFMVHIDDTNGSFMNVTWEYWDGANWVLFGSNLTNNVNGTYYKLPSPWFDLYGHTYYYRITLTGNQTASKVVTFFTQASPGSTAGMNDTMFACIILLTIFGTFLPLGYAVRRRSAGIYLTMSGFTFLGLIAFLPFNPATLMLMLVFAGYICMLGIKKAFYSKI